MDHKQPYKQTKTHRLGVDRPLKVKYYDTLIYINLTLILKMSTFSYTTLPGVLFPNTSSQRV